MHVCDRDQACYLNPRSKCRAKGNKAQCNRSIMDVSTSHISKRARLSSLRTLVGEESCISPSMAGALEATVFFVLSVRFHIVPFPRVRRRCNGDIGTLLELSHCYAYASTLSSDDNILETRLSAATPGPSHHAVYVQHLTWCW